MLSKVGRSPFYLFTFIWIIYVNNCSENKSIVAVVTCLFVNHFMYADGLLFASISAPNNVTRRRGLLPKGNILRIKLLHEKDHG